MEVVLPATGTTLQVMNSTLNRTYAIPVLISSLYMPQNLKEAGQLASQLGRFTDENYVTVMLSIVALYIILQTFSIPGTIFVNVVCGSLFGLKVAFILTLGCATLGASAAFMGSKLFGRRLFLAWFPDQIQAFTQEVELHRHNLFSYLLFLRITPFLPNWLINIASPILRIPFPHFFFATLLGVAPQTFIAVNAGVTVTQITDPTAKLMGPRTWLCLTSIGCLALMPVLFKVYRRRLRRGSVHHD